MGSLPLYGGTFARSYSVSTKVGCFKEAHKSDCQKTAFSRKVRAATLLAMFLQQSAQHYPLAHEVLVGYRWGGGLPQPGSSGLLGILKSLLENPNLLT